MSVYPIRNAGRIPTIPIVLTWGAYAIGLLSSFFAYLYLRRKSSCVAPNLVVDQLISDFTRLQRKWTVHRAFGFICLLDWYRLLYAHLLIFFGLIG